MDEEKVYYTIILRHDTSTNWMMNNPILALSEYGVEDDTHRVKRGDGQSNWSDLPYEHFGLEYLVTFEGLLGEVNDSQALKEAFNEKVDKSIFSDNANGLIENITLTTEDGAIGKITRVTKDVTTGAARAAYLRVISSDNSIQGVYTIDDQGVKVLNLKSYSHISDYEPGKTYYINEICYVDNKLYRCIEEEFIAEPSFTKAHWVLLASLHSNDIKYNHLVSGLEAENVKEALDELTDLDSQKVKKTSRENKVYGTNEYGEQFLYNKDDLRKLDTVNHKQADLNKNVQIDAADINYSDAHPELGTVKAVLDSKVDKTVAGSGARIVRDVQFEYNEISGYITLIEDKVSLENGTSSEERREIDVVSEQELTGQIQGVNDRIDQEVQTLNNTINTKETAIYDTIDTKESEIYEVITTKESEIYNTINTKESEIYNVIDTKEAALQAEIDTTNSELERVETESKARDNNLNTNINNAVNTLNNIINHQVDILNETIQNNVDTLNNTIDTKEGELYQKIADEKAALNLRIDTEVADLETEIDTEVATLNNTINTKDAAMDTKKVNKSIAPGLVSEIVAATQSNEPTLKITTKNTTTETATVSHLHFKAQGRIQTRFQDADHIVIDSTTIDDKNDQQDTRLTNAEARILANETSITALQTHDAAHDNTLALHTQQIADNTHDIQDLQADMLEAESDIARLQTQNANQETHLTTHDQDIQDINDAIILTNQNVTRNATDIATLNTNKANKTFANLTNNKVVGTIATQALQSNEIIKLGVTSVDPSTETTSSGILKVISSDNTIIATRDQDTGVIDLKANLDTDVNYFITTEILDPTIPSENIIPLNTLTPTDKVDVEVQDIITDPEGTWARVQSINTTLQTCVAVSFKNHTEATWGHIGGNIQLQSDLQNQFSQLETDIEADITAEENARIAADGVLQDNIDAEELARTNADQTLQDNIDAEETARIAADTNLNTTKVDKTDVANKVYGTDSNGDQTTYDKNDFGKVDTVNGKQPDANKNVSVYASDIKMGGYDYSPYIDNYLNKVYLIGASNDHRNLTQSIQIPSASGSTTQTSNIGFQSGDNSIKGTVTSTQNGNDINNNVDLQVDAENVIFDPDTSSIVATKLAEAIRELSTSIDNLKNDLQTQISTYNQNTSYTATGTYTAQKYVTFENAQGVVLMAKILTTFTSDNTEATVYESFIKDVESGNLKLIGIPEQIDGGSSPTPSYEDVFNILDDVDGQGDTYSDLGGTEQEVEDILDEIIGNE